MTELQIRALQAKLDDRDRQLQEAAGQLDTLKADFSFNLRLIDERDAELQQFDESFASVQALLHEKERELSEVKVTNAELESLRKDDHRKLSEQEAFLQAKLREARDLAENTRWNHDEEMRRHREELEAMRRELHRQGREREELLEEQRKDVTSTYEETMRQRESAMRRQIDELAMQLKGQEGKAAEERRQRERAMAEHAFASRRSGELEGRLKELELAARQTEWKAETELKQWRERFETLETDHRDALHLHKRQKETLEAQTMELKQGMAALQQSLVQLGHKHEEASRRAEHRHKDILQAAQTEITRLQHQLNEANARADAHDTEAQQLHVRLEQDTSKLRKQNLEDTSTQRQQLDALSGEVRDLKREARAKETDVQAAVAALADARRMAQAETAEAAALRLQVSELESSLEDARRVAEERSAEAQRATYVQESTAKRCDRLEQDLRQAEATADGLRKDVHAAREQSRAGGGVPLAPSAHHAAAPSPLFSDDFGAVSPPRPLGSLADSDAPARHQHEQNDGGHSPVGFAFPPSSSERLSGGGTDSHIRTVMDENTALRSVIASMRRQMDELVNEQQTTPRHDKGMDACDDSSDHLRRAREHIAVLQRRQGALERQDWDEATAAAVEEVQLLRAQVGEFDAMLERCRTERDLFKTKAERLHQQLLQLQHQHQHQQATQQQAHLRPDGKPLSSDVSQLQTDLRTVEGERSRLLQERTKLIQVSNQLRADLQRALSASTSELHTGSPDASALERAVAQAEQRSVERIQQLEDVLVQVASENKTLKKEVRKHSRQVRAQQQLLQQQQDELSNQLPMPPPPPPPEPALPADDAAAPLHLQPADAQAHAGEEEEAEVEVVPAEAVALAVSGLTGGGRRGTASSKATPSQLKAAAMIKQMNAKRSAQRSDLMAKAQEARQRVRAMAGNSSAVET